MIDVLTCPVCESPNWRHIGERAYRRNEADSEYLRRRFVVLFDLWKPGLNEFRASFIVCEGCGFCCYSPRPTEAELEAKYRYLNLHLVDSRKVPSDSPVELQRAENICRLLRPSLKPASRILDFGGGDGRLMMPLVDEGHGCFVLDHNDKVLPGVKWLEGTLDEIPPTSVAAFDAIICSHVIEHLADPFGTLLELRRRMRGDGVMYVEVPMEIWRDMPAREEPVTHINFFTSYSMKALLQRAGLSVMSCRHEAYDHPSGHRATVVRAMCRRSASIELDQMAGAKPVQLLLKPGLKQRVKQAWVHRDQAIRNLVSKFK